MVEQGRIEATKPLGLNTQDAYGIDTSGTSVASNNTLNTQNANSDYNTVRTPQTERNSQNQSIKAGFDANFGAMTGYMSAKAIFGQNMYNSTGINMFHDSGATGYYAYNGGTAPNIFGDGTTRTFSIIV